ncbi:hypothetical protein K440DRAFT_592051 [Wilcoxina mikolae CBS 423.85]|nr:hypothetical protein K440DRAFT_592051 [Wilcoxina mikolae CBS 423.85]
MLEFTFYAELLPNIQSINLLISLSSPTTAFTRTTIDPGSSSATLHHNGESASLILPAPVNPGLWQLVLKPTPGELNLSGRLPLVSSLPITYITRGNNAPWSATDLSSSTPISFDCRSCSAVLIPIGQITQWKNLPSANWVEMMDFWHCHKPMDNTKEKTQGSSQKRSLFEKGLVVDQGIGFVELESFLVLDKDCKAAKIIDSRVICSACHCLLGYPDKRVTVDDSRLLKLNKWNLSLNKNETFPLECFLATKFISYAEDEGIRRLLVSNISQSDALDTRLKIWIFNPDIRFTSTQSSKPLRGLKVLWQSITPAENVTTDSFHMIGFEAVVLDPNAFHTLKRCLHITMEVFHRNIEKSEGWNVGVLRRFEET